MPLLGNLIATKAMERLFLFFFFGVI